VLFFVNLISFAVNNFSDISKKAKKREKQKKRKKQLDTYRHRLYMQLNKQRNISPPRARKF
jgi:hypothetical protein